MSQQCPICGQVLPKGLDETEVTNRLEKISRAAATRAREMARRELETEYTRRLAEQKKTIRASVEDEIRASSRTEIANLKRELQKAERQSRKESERVAKEAVKQSQREIDALKKQAAKERTQQTAESARLKATIDKLSLKLERQTSELMGETCEADVYATLKNAFGGDDIQRVSRGVRGADIVHRVLVEGKELGRIIYECKNVSTWDNNWLSKAKEYRKQYDTPWVVIATRTFPRREKLFVIERGVPVIDLRLIVKLAQILRDAVVEVGHLRTSQISRQGKADEIFQYILSDHFVGRFNGIAEAVTALRDQQRKERDSHRLSWEKQTQCYDEIDEGRSEIGARIRSISEGRKRLAVVVSR